MGRWLLMLSGLLAWAVHFTGLYLLASLEDVTGRASVWRLTAVGLTALCLLAAATGGALAVRSLAGWPDSSRRLMAEVGLLGAGLGVAGIAWQSLTLLFG